MYPEYECGVRNDSEHYMLQRYALGYKTKVININVGKILISLDRMRSFPFLILLFKVIATFLKKHTYKTNFHKQNTILP